MSRSCDLPAEERAPSLSPATRTKDAGDVAGRRARRPSQYRARRGGQVDKRRGAPPAALSNPTRAKGTRAPPQRPPSWCARQKIRPRPPLMRQKHSHPQRYHGAADAIPARGDGAGTGTCNAAVSVTAARRSTATTRQRGRSASANTSTQHRLSPHFETRIVCAYSTVVGTCWLK